MVNQNYVLYVNEKRILRTAKIELFQIGLNHNLRFSIPEKHLICGMILKGRPIKGDRLKDFPLKPIEKYLFEFSNIHFIIPDLEYTVENSDYSYNISQLDDFFEVIQPVLHLTMQSNGYYEVRSNVFPVGLQVSYDGVVWTNAINQEFNEGGIKYLAFGDSYYMRLTTLDLLHQSEVCFYQHIVAGEK
jgi:hypothetical protein